MKNRKILFIIIPIMVVLLVLIAGIIFLKLNSKPEKIFSNSISAVFKILETDEEQATTMKGTMNLTANVESDSAEMQEINAMLEGAGITLDMEVDTNNMIVNENIKVIYDNENLINATLLLQDQKGYIYLPDWLDKYLELTEDYLEYSELTEYSKNIATLDQDKLMGAIKEELITAILNQELSQEKTTLILDGQETKVTASTLSLKDEQITTFYNDFFGNLNKNENFQIALGEYKDDVQKVIDEMLLELEEAEDIGLEFTIYTKGFLNKFVGVSGKAIDYYSETTTGLNLFKHNDSKYEFVAYSEYDEEREDILNITIENKKESRNKGTTTITSKADEVEYVIVYNYEKQGNQTTFEASTDIEGAKVIISGTVTENGSNYKGNLIFTVEQEEFGKINLNCDYDFTYGVEVQKKDVQNAVLIDELSEEDQNEFTANLQNSTLYQTIEQMGLLDFSIGISNDLPEVTYDGYTVKYSVPDDFEESSFNSEDMKTYMDDTYNSVNVYISNDTANTYMKNLENEYVLTSSLYKNQQISETKKYTVNGKEYLFRTITYDDEYSSYINLYFVYGLDDKYCYVVEVETEGGQISMDTIKYFLDITV